MDIGCGKGIEGSAELTQSIAQHCRTCIGIEPDTEIAPPPVFSALHRCALEEAPIQAESVDVAFSYMVTEHLGQPQEFLDRIFRILRPNGVFWTITVDARHWFAPLSRAMERMRIKRTYLQLLHGERGQERYENYPVHYRLNRPSDFEAVGQGFPTRSYINLYRPSEVAYYFPPRVAWLASAINATTHAFGVPGSLLMARLQKSGAP